MQRRRFVLGLAHTTRFSTSRIGSAEPQPHAVFLNPGEPVERGSGPYWRMVNRFMQPAARSLGLHLEVLYAERDHLLMLRQAEAVARRSPAPPCVIIVNEKLAAQQMLKTLSRSPAKVFVMHNDLTPQQRGEIGNERQQIRNWIGTATTDIARGGYILMTSFAATPAGSYLIGAWAIVILYDYHRGVDFAAHGLAQAFDLMYVVHRENVSRFSEVALKRTEALDFRVHSKAWNSEPGPYDLRLARLVAPGHV